MYHDKILEGPVKKWIKRGDDFCLEEDGASGHGGGSQGQIRFHSDQIEG